MSVNAKMSNVKRGSMLLKLFFYVLFCCVMVLHAGDINYNSLNNIDRVVNEAIEDGHTPGAVVLVGFNDHVVYKKAFGYTSVDKNELMSVDTLFDLASLTKLFTAISIMRLAEQGYIRLSDPVCLYIPAFCKNDKATITIEDLLLHLSGMPAANSIGDYMGSHEATIEVICNVPLDTPIRSQFVYSDLGYIILGEIVQVVSHKKLNEYIDETILWPLRMNNTCYVPSEKMRNRIAPTGKRDTRLIQGEVHDPRAHLLGGISGHAGLFSNVDDLMKICKMILNQGTLDDIRILSKLTVQKMVKINNLPDNNQRAIGWDVKTRFATFKGDLFTEAIGHTGFTGTSILIDPISKVYIIILSNRVNMENGDVASLRGKIANIVASSLD